MLHGEWWKLSKVIFELLMSYFLQAATSATKEWLTLHQLKKTQRPIWLFSTELTLQSEHLKTAVIQDCAWSKRPAATTKVMQEKKPMRKEAHTSLIYSPN